MKPPYYHIVLIQRPGEIWWCFKTRFRTIQCGHIVMPAVVDVTAVC